MKNKQFVVTILVLGFSIVAAASIASRKPPVVIETNLENIPMKIGKYKAEEDVFPQSVYDELNADKHVYRHYTSPSGDVIDLYIGYYSTAKGGRTGHNPNACLPGAGWGIIKEQKVALDTAYKGAKEKVNYVVSKNSDVYNVMLHWYQANGTKVLDSGIEQNIERFLGQVIYNKNDGAFVRVSTYSQKGEIRNAKALIKSFAEKILIELPKYWPVEREL